MNEPVFFGGDHLTIGAGLGSVWADRDFGKKYEPSLYVSPAFFYEVNVTSWASYTVWPLYWKFLLTGNQYADSSSLRIGKINVAVSGGVSGIAYNQKDGLTTSFALGAELKYLFNQCLFNETSIQYDMYNTKKPAYALSNLSTSLGVQIDRSNSLTLAYDLVYYRIPENEFSNKYGLLFGDTEGGSELMISHSLYLTPKHRLGPEIGFGYRNLDFTGKNYFKAGFHYRYSFG